MSILDQTQFVERLQFFNGQRLFASDLQGIDDFNREMRWLHNTSLHQPGIGNGFAVSGRKGDRQVIVNPGYALDAGGREIVLTHPETLQIPPVAGSGNGNSAFYALTVSYPDDAALEEAESREIICAPGQSGVIRRREEPVFCWIRLSGDGGDPVHEKSKQDLLSFRKIRLAQIEVLNCQLKQAPSFAQRCNARPHCGPHVHCGKVPLSDFDLKKIDADMRVNLNLTHSGVRTLRGEKRIDTSRAGFLTTPNYFANLQGERLIELTSKLHVIILDMIRVGESSANHVDISIILILITVGDSELREGPGESSSGPGNFEQTVKSQLNVVWMGVEQ